VLDLQTDTSNIAVHELPDIGMIDTLLVWRRGHFSSALNALRRALVASQDGAADPAESAEFAESVDPAELPGAAAAASLNANAD
jgi:hypothetical protein